MVDYVLNVAVGISAGVGALVSAVPSLHPHTLALCLAILVLIALANLRGTLDAGRLFALPTYVFIASFLLVLAIGAAKEINALGASATGVALVVIVAAKFTEGAWITVLVIPGMVVLLRSIKGYYDQLDASLRDDEPLSFADVEPPVVLVATQGWNKLTDKALSFALRLSPHVNAVHLTRLAGPDDDDTAAIRDKWAKDVEAPARAAGLRPPRLLLLRSDYRVIHEPLLKLLKQLQEEFPSRTIAVLLPELVKTSWWQLLLHTHRARRLRSRLLRFGGSRLVIINIPWYLKEPRIEQGIVEEPLNTPTA
jgi:hypothetical protein